MGERKLSCTLRFSYLARTEAGNVSESQPGTTRFGFASALPGCGVGAALCHLTPVQAWAKLFASDALLKPPGSTSWIQWLCRPYFADP